MCANGTPWMVAEDTRMKQVNISPGSPVSSEDQEATAVHARLNDGDHLVGIGNLRVVIVQDEALWFAQGLEIDYAAQGQSLETVKTAFEDGLCWTIHEHLKVYGNIERFLRPAPPDIWKELLYDQLANVNSFSSLSWHKEIEQKPVKHLPFEGIEYLQRSAVAA